MKKALLAIALLAGGIAGRAEPKKNLPETAKPPVHALFALTNTCNWLVVDGKRINLFDGEVDGVVNYTTWNMVEPEQGKFRYPGFDRMINEAGAAGKYLAYNIIPGNHAPKWVYDQGIETFEYSMPDGRKCRSYLPWNTVDGKRVLNTKLLDIWRHTVTAYSQYLYQHPNRDRISYVAITGFPFGNGLELMVPLNYEDCKRLKYDREAEDLYIEFVQRCVDIFIECLPDFPLGLAFTDYFGANPDGTHRRSTREVDAIMAYAVKKANLKGVTLVPMGLWLGHRGIVNDPKHALMRQMSKFQPQVIGIALEGQMGSYKSKNYLPLEEQLDLALNMKASWVQLWHHDIVYGPYQPILKKYREKFRNAK